MLGFLLFSQFRSINPDATIDHIIKTWLNDHCLSDPDDSTLREDESSFYFKSFLLLQTLQLVTLNNSHHLPEGDGSSPVFSASNILVPVSLSLVPGKASAVQPLFPTLVCSLMWVVRMLNCFDLAQNTVFSALKKNIFVCLQWILPVISKTLQFPRVPSMVL